LGREAAMMRVFIGAQPKTGNVWVRKLLCHLYGFEDLNENPELVQDLRANGFAKFVTEGRFPEHAIVQQHLLPSAALLDAAWSISCRLVTVVRDPYDTFVSFYCYVNRMPERFRDTPAGIMTGKPIDHPDVLDFLRNSYPRYLKMSRHWVKCGKATVVRYEELHAAPLESVRSLADCLEPVSDERIVQAVAECSAERMRQRGGWIAQHVRVAKPGTGKEDLRPAHFDILRLHCSELIQDLGYEVL
jgi:hypothetical protein